MVEMSTPPSKTDPEILISPTNILLGQAVSSIWLPGSTKLLYTAQSLSPHSSCPCNWMEKSIAIIKKIASAVAMVTSSKVSCDLIPNMFWLDLKKIDFSPKAGIKKLSLTKGEIYAGDAVKDLKDSQSFTFLFQTPVM